MKHEISTSGSTSCLVSNVIVCRDGKSPYWMGQWRDGRGRKEGEEAFQVGEDNRGEGECVP